jgi:hypothetical protein
MTRRLRRERRRATRRRELVLRGWRVRRRGPEEAAHAGAHGQELHRAPRRRCEAMRRDRRDTPRTAAPRLPKEVRGNGARTLLTTRRTTQTHPAGRPSRKGRSSCVDRVPGTRAQAVSSRSPDPRAAGARETRLPRPSVARSRAPPTLLFCRPTTLRAPSPDYDPGKPRASARGSLLRPALRGIATGRT